MFNQFEITASENVVCIIGLAVNGSSSECSYGYPDIENLSHTESVEK